MRKAFTLWPPSNEISEQQISSDGIPKWALIEDRSPLAAYRPWKIVICIVVLLALIIVAALSPNPRFSLPIASLAAILILAYGIAHYKAIATLRRELDSAQRWNETIFHQSGIALWREDWTVARDEVLAILNSGEQDIQAYFAARPDELREIRKKVIIKDINDAALVRSGAASKREVLGPLDRILPDVDDTFLQWLVAFARGDVIYQSEAHLTLPDGTVKDTLFSAALPRDMRGFEDILINDLDITEYKAAQAKLKQAEIEIVRAARISTMGALAASIAHEVNSPLAAIVASSEAALIWLRREQPNIQEAISAMLAVNQQAIRARAVVDRTKALVSHSQTTFKSHSMDSLVCEAIQFIQRDLRSLQATTHMNVPESLPPVFVDAINIQQVLINLILNAAQAMSEKALPKDISINARVDKRMMIVSVSDSGTGIDPDKLATIFEPFYTTKENGMGMGLAICRTCVGAHGGEIWVSNRPGKGATFHFSLPLTTGT